MPDEGRQLAIANARRVVKATQPDAVHEQLREVYADDAAIAAASNYWREPPRDDAAT